MLFFTILYIGWIHHYTQENTRYISLTILTQAARDIFVESWRVLDSGGHLAIMDIDPKSPFFRKLSQNPFAFSAFKSTEPWIQGKERNGGGHRESEGDYSGCS